VKELNLVNVSPSYQQNKNGALFIHHSVLVRRHWLQAKTNESCNSCASLAGLVLSFIACFILLVIAPLAQRHRRVDYFKARLSRVTLSSARLAC